MSHEVVGNETGYSKIKAESISMTGLQRAV